jgi:hypothetical protein
VAEKRKVLKVDKLVIRADEIFVERDGKEIEIELLRQQELSSEKHPWDVFGSNQEKDINEEELVEEDSSDEEDEQSEEQRGWSWI